MQISVLHNTCSQLLEVIFLLVQTEAQYNLDTINNIFTVGVVKWGSSIFILWCWNPEERVLHRNLSLQRLVYQAILRIFFRALIFWWIRFLKKLKMWTMWGKERCGTYFLRFLKRCFWSHRSRKEGLVYAGWSGRSYVILFVVLVLNVADRQMYGLSMLTTNVSRLDVPNCDLVFMRLYSSLRQDDTEDIFLSFFTDETEV